MRQPKLFRIEYCSSWPAISLWAFLSGT